MSKYQQLDEDDQNSGSYSKSNSSSSKQNLTFKSSRYDQALKELQYNHQRIKEDFKHIFDLDNIREQKSIQVLNDIGGIAHLAKELDIDLNLGMNTKDKNQMEQRELYFGLNDPIIIPPKTLWFLVKEQFEDQTLRILLAATVISFVIGMLKDFKMGWIDGTGIGFAILIIVAITTTNNYLKERQFQKLNKKVEERFVQVIRNGKNAEITIFQLLVGDVYSFKQGDVLPVDGILISGYKVFVDESAMTGETDLIEKIQAPLGKSKINQQSNLTPFLISGSRVMEGAGTLLVCQVGVNTIQGQMKIKLFEEQQATPLQEKLEIVADKIGKLGIGTAIATFAVLTVYLIIDISQGKYEFFGLDTLTHFVNFLMIGITIVVMAVPEGLPLAVTIALAFSLGRMRSDNNLVKHMADCETMGGANNICTDKTGTLTLNQMTVEKLFIEEEEKPINKNTFCQSISQKTNTLFFESICINSDSILQHSKGKIEHIGNKTECALLELAYSMGFNYEKYRPNQRIHRVIHFNSTRKRMTTLYYNPNSNAYKVFCKGASEIVITLCTKILTRRGPIPITSQIHSQLTNQITEYGKKTLRTIAIAFKDFSGDAQSSTDEQIESDLVLIAVCGIRDPLRPKIKRAIKACHTAGITVRMVTGDNVVTACAIAKEAGIFDDLDYLQQSSFSQDKQSIQLVDQQQQQQQQQPQGQQQENFTVLEGKKFRQLVGGIVYEQANSSESDLGSQHSQKSQVTMRTKNQQLIPKVANIKVFERIAQDLRVLARSTPEDKFILVTGLIQLQNVVAVTGDGTNDAPALKKSDVGFAMASGTEIAKEAAGIIMLDDNFHTIVNAVKWGRNIYDCVRKFIQFQLTVNIVALVMAFLGACTSKESPITPIQMLWVNLIMDTFASLALATEPPGPHLLKNPPYSRKESMVTLSMWKNIIGQSVYQISMLSIILYLGPTLFHLQNSFAMEKWNPEQAKHLTIFFHTFVLLQAFNQINCRKLKGSEINVFKGFFNNLMFFIIQTITLTVQFFIIQFGGQFVHCAPLTVKQHLTCLFIGMGSLIVSVIIKLLPNKCFQKVGFMSLTSMEQGSNIRMHRRRGTEQLSLVKVNSNTSISYQLQSKG